MLDVYQTPPTPICDRCHSLAHHCRGVPIIHPSIASLQDIISESPHKYNHIYHVLDAADFPLSLIPNLQRQLCLSPQRSHNRRAKADHFHHGRAMDMSFIITRADLLAPRKEQVDSLMPYLVQVLRDALGRIAENSRLGNVRCVSAKRGWWTSQVKEDIWNRGGGGWMVGKINVGKSNLFGSIYPKGRTEKTTLEPLRYDCEQGPLQPRSQLSKSGASTQPMEYPLCLDEERREVMHTSLLPPQPHEVSFPVLPLVSSLPGTTVSPIRLPYGNGKGELIDLPGLDRGDLGAFVMDNHKQDLVMRDRAKPKQISVRPGQSLLVGGLVRLTPLTPDITLLAYPFVPLASHVTSNDKVILIHEQKRAIGGSSIAKSGIGNCIASAGKFSIKWDVTKQRAGPLTRKDAGGLNPQSLPFIIFSMDLLIEGCGWIELVAQMRRKHFELPLAAGSVVDDRPYPQVEIHSPGGRYIGVRKPMNAWIFNESRLRPSTLKARPRKSMQGVKKRMKQNK